jgi:Fe-S-cluster-containing dehydrogenase component
MKTVKLQRNPDVTVRYRGIMEKCSYCTQRIEEAKVVAKRDGKDRKALPDGAVVPACAQACPTGAITFGNINDPESRVAKLKTSERNYEMLQELNVRPRTSYLARVRNENEELS